jgi:hypothetical protein
MKKVLGYALYFYIAALLVSWGVGLLRQALPVLIPVGLVALGIVVYARIRRYKNSTKY